MRKRPENSWRQANSQGICRKFGAKTESNVVQKTAERPGWERGLSGLSYYRFATTARCDDFSLVRFWTGRPSQFTLAFDNSALTPVAIFAESILYRAWPTGLRLPFPKQLETLAMPAHQGLGFDNDQGFFPIA